ncbi:Crp/Fnr family transcriptional regulator [Polluticaenibacter yanchengensis]|uniref:Crp/Fnr family transcriptional regulator n=1 Tax=Polluticaenibacter yanchengensis TaxID=3014562 RepID=A0ABT4UH36_9BACT|nr:Crp/Fnr family transcriptional regulator [Chitinophagaceae bacterium LY-5]
MFEELEKAIKNRVNISESELTEMYRHFTPKKIRKKQLLLEEGDICNRVAFVEKGALFSYSTDEKGGIHIMQFAFEGWWMSDLFSFFTNEPSKLCIEALEDSEVLLISKEKHAELLQKMPVFESYMRQLYQNAYVSLQRRMEETIGLSAEEKYSRFLNGPFSGLLSRVPQHLIASYLGITPETLSRVRRQFAS